MEGKSIPLPMFLTFSSLPYETNFRSIEETLRSYDPQSCVQFVCGTIILFEKSFGMKNKAAMQKMLKEAVDNYGVGSANQNMECMIPIYSLLTKYCKSFPVCGIFETLYESDSCRRCAMLYVEWSRCHSDFAKKLEVLELGLCSKAEPVSDLKYEMKEVLKLEERSSVQESTNAGQPSCSHDSVFKKSVNELSAKRALFCGKCTNLVENDNVSCDQSSAEYDFVRSGSNSCENRVSSTSCDSPTLHNLDTSRLSDANCQRYYDSDAENINPSGVSSETTVRRKHAGILVAALDFPLEDYDLGDDSCTNLKSLEVLKREDNETNIKNNLPSDETGPSSSSISPCAVVKRLTPSPPLSDTW